MSRNEVVARIQALKAFPGFRDLPPQYLAALGARATVVAFAEGTFIQQAGEVATRVCIVLDGTVELRRAGRRLGEVREYGLVLGPMALSDQPALHEAVTLTDVEALVLDLDVARTLIADNHATFTAALCDLAYGLTRVRERAGAHRGFAKVAQVEPLGKTGVTERMRALVECPLFQRVPVDVVSAVAVAGAVVQADEGDIVLARGQRPDGALFPIYGELACTHADCPVTLGSGVAVGFEEMLSLQAMRCTFRATRESAFLHVERDTLFDDVEDDEDACLALLVGLSNTARAVVDQTVDSPKR